VNKRLQTLLVCPKCKAKLEYQAANKEMFCRHDQLAFPVRKNVPVLLEMDARKTEARNNQ